MPDVADEPEPTLADQRWPLTPTQLLARERWLWWDQLWADVRGQEPFDPRRDRGAFRRSPIDAGCQPPPRG
jgi:hypothetical protein